MGNKNSKITTHDRAVLDLLVQRDKLKQYQKKIQTVAEKETQVAKDALLKNNKRVALLALRKKKYQEQLLSKTDAQLLNLEQLTQSIEFALVEKELLAGIEQGNLILKEIHKEMSIDKVEKLMEDTADAIAYQDEISELLSGKLTNDDEDEILAELAQIEKDQLVENLPAVPVQDFVSEDITEDIEESIPQQKVKVKTPQKQLP
ncbi:1805_t:CDS:2 [Funneliformis geosporum]|uniref:16460_t:CDS:1 n=1 Tax=Funneliformis geosporum TaxID=1117311 RepID=A0A9W4SEI5_9GLOM|nr:1805_t:CDS:2 [Funneliformis geosporum]CAI2165640.1 16460_t:CDS:2 [Funneliformis geosporum]